MTTYTSPPDKRPVTVIKLVLIGQDVPKVQVRQELAACLCTKEEIGHALRSGSLLAPLPAFN